MLRSARKSCSLIAAVALAVAVGAAAPDSSLACPNCGKAVAKQNNGKSLETGYQASILLLMTTPFVILGGLTALFSWEIRKAKLRADATATGNATDAGSATESSDSGSFGPETRSN
ncbi:MAG TPA: hypothetical protein VGE52_15970 [Pirellulales bacterium]